MYVGITMPTMVSNMSLVEEDESFDFSNDDVPEQARARVVVHRGNGTLGANSGRRRKQA